MENDVFMRIPVEKLKQKARELYEALAKEEYLKVSTARDFGTNDDHTLRLIWLTGRRTNYKEYFMYCMPDSAIANEDGSITLDLFKPQTYEEWCEWNHREQSEAYGERFYKGKVGSIKDAITMIRRCYSGISGADPATTEGQLKLF